MIEVTHEEVMQLLQKAIFTPSTYEKIVNGEVDVEKLFNSSDTQELSEDEQAAEDASIANFDNSNKYDNVTCKTLVIGAEYDGINPPEWGHEVAKNITGAKFELIKDAGHMVYYEQPEFSKVVKEFLND